MPLISTLILFSIFASNVTLGAMTSKPFLSDVGEMLVLIATAVMFVATILRKEAAAKNRAAK